MLNSSMSLTTAVSVAVLAVSTCGSPGPNNIIAMGSGANFGMTRSIHAIAGINVGFPVTLAIVVIGFEQVVVSHPLLLHILKPIAVLYLLWLAWNIAKSKSSSSNTVDEPLEFWRMALFQAINPKSWIMVLAALTAFVPARAGIGDIFLISVVFLLFGTPCSVAWCFVGRLARRVLYSSRAFARFNIAMGLLLAASAVSLLFTGVRA